MPEQPAPLEAQAPEAAPAPPPQAHADQGKERSFASLFGWKSKPADEPTAPVAKPVVDDESFDDDLEIPAFLRRSGQA